jgi:magnesium-transporting ATPase (P-type)
METALQPIADWFAQFGIPAPIVKWGHPVMMGIVIFVMGSFTAWIGWQGRIARDPVTKAKARAFHSKLAPALFTFIALGYTGGVLALVMQGKPIFTSAHFWTGTVVVGLLAANGLIALTKFGGGSLRTVHAYLGSAAMGLLFLHAFLGLGLGLAL